MFFFLFKQKTAYEMRISDWSSDVCSSDLGVAGTRALRHPVHDAPSIGADRCRIVAGARGNIVLPLGAVHHVPLPGETGGQRRRRGPRVGRVRSEEHTSELQSLMRISYAVFCLKKKIYLNLQGARF